MPWHLRLFAAVALAVMVSCRRHTLDTGGAPTPSPSVSTALAASSAPAPDGAGPKERDRCTAAEGQFTLSPLDGETNGHEEPNVELPFAVELGSAVAYQDGFAISALRGGAGQNIASIAVLPASLNGGRFVELGPIHGDVAAPKVAAAIDGLIAVVPDSDAGGSSLRLARVTESPAGFDVSWGVALHDGDDESQAFEVAVSGDRGTVLWDDWDKAKNTGVIRSSVFKSSALAEASAAKVLSSPKVDAESPRVIGRAHGFWVAWVVNDEVQRAGGKPAAGRFDDDNQDEEHTLVPTRRGIELRPLDELGNPSGVAKRVTPEGSLVLDFDLAQAPDGGAWLVWREGAPSVASSGGKLSLVLVAADGTLTPQKLDDIELGNGSPVLLTNPLAGQWLLVPGNHEETEITRLGAAIEPLAPLSKEAALRYSIPLALRDNDLLVAHPRGRSVVLHTVRCQ